MLQSKKKEKPVKEKEGEKRVALDELFKIQAPKRERPPRDRDNRDNRDNRDRDRDRPPRRGGDKKRGERSGNNVAKNQKAPNVTDPESFPSLAAKA